MEKERQNKDRENIGKLLIDSLTKDQVASLPDVLFSTGDMHKYMNMFEKADPDMAKTVSNVIEIRDEKTDKSSIVRVASDQRIIEHWDSLWRRWESLVCDVGDEEGRYATQEEHWEPPYFNGFALADDLDPIAKDMLPLIEEVYDLVDDPDVFSDAMETINENILSYPEWMDVESNEGCTLGTYATQCVLKWLWLSCQDDEHPGQTILKKIYEMEENNSMVELDNNACIDFFTKFSEQVCREIHRYLKNNTLKYNLENIYSRWHKIHHFYDERYDSAHYLDTCQKHLAENWRYGRPLIEDALNKGQYQEADLLFEKTFSCYLRSGDKKAWYPETSLLLTEKEHFCGDDSSEEVSGLLELWADVSRKLGNTKRGAASQLQGVIFRAPEYWDAVLIEYKKALSSEVREVIDPLFTQWKDQMAQRSISYSIGKAVSSDTWIHWLIDAELDVAEKREWFMEKLNAWLAHLKENAHAFTIQWQVLARLTRDMPENERVKKEFPTFFKIVLPSDTGMSLLNNARCGGLQKMNVSSCFSPIMDVWRKHLHSIIPDPAHSHKSDYSSHAQWMKALYELNRDAYNEMLAKWRNEHKRRSNLWRDMKSQSLPF